MGWGGSAHCTYMQVHSYWLEFSECVSIGNAQLTLNVAAFRFVVESCEHQMYGLELF